MMCRFRSSYTGRVDVAVVEHNLRGKLGLYKNICQDFAEMAVKGETIKQLERWDKARANAAILLASAESKRRKAEKKVRKTRLLQREAVRSGTYIYVTSEEQAAQFKRDDDSGSETETDRELHSHK